MTKKLLVLSEVNFVLMSPQNMFLILCSKDAIDRLSQNTFTDVGNILQKRRLTDFVENFGCHLTDSVRLYKTEMILASLEF